MPAQDPYSSWPSYPGSAFANGKAVTPSDTVDLETIPVSLYIGGTGDLTVTMANDEKATFKNIATNGSLALILPIRVKRVWATGTTVTGIVALW